MTLGWDDLLIEDVAESDIQTWLAEWRGVLDGPVDVAFLNSSASGSCDVRTVRWTCWTSSPETSSVWPTRTRRSSPA